ncbi:MAG: cyclic nucleotide-binding domain-containing protein [Lysobacteraceae bacterium]
MSDSAPRIESIELDAGRVVIDFHQPADALYRIESGTVRIEQAGLMHANTAGPGDFFGESALVPGSLPNVRAVAVTAVKLAKIPRMNLEKVLASEPPLAATLAHNLAGYLVSLRHAVGTASRISHDASNTLPSMRLSQEIQPVLRNLAETTGSRYQLRHANLDIPLPLERGNLLIGRPDPTTGAAPDIDLSPLDMARGLSRRHARLWHDSSGVSLREEPRVANGTWVNNRRLNPGESVTLQPGDRLRFGAIELVFDCG